MVDLQKLERKVLRGGRLEETLEDFDWKEFERTVGEIFRQNDFRVRKNFRFKTKRRYENDLIAIRNEIVICADCKRWAAHREKSWGIVKAAKEQEKRTAELKKFVRVNPIARDLMKIPEATFVPMIVTLYQENLLRKGKTFVVPVKKLNSFLLECELII